MTFTQMNFPTRLLTSEEETELSKRIEASIYANHLLERPQLLERRLDLEAVARRGAEAMQTMVLQNMRLVCKIAREFAFRHNAPIDDLIQEGSIALMEAVARFDHRYEGKFSTLAHTYVSRALVTWVNERSNTSGFSSNRRITRLRALRGEDESAATFLAAAKQVGMDAASAIRASSTWASLEDADDAALKTFDDLDQVEFSTDFLALMSDGGWFLRQRFGIGCQAVTRQEMAARLGQSLSSVMRMEQRHLDEARALLEADTCRARRRPARPQVVG